MSDKRVHKPHINYPKGILQLCCSLDTGLTIYLVETRCTQETATIDQNWTSCVARRSACITRHSQCVHHLSQTIKLATLPGRVFQYLTVSDKSNIVDLV